MDEILKKIEAMKKLAERLLVKATHDRLDEIQNDISNGYITACDELTEFILTKQKINPCDNCIGPSLAISRGIKDMRIKAD